MRKQERIGTKYLPELDKQLDENQIDIINDLTHPHSYQLTEMLGASHRIVARVAATNPEAQPTQARGHIVWNKAYSFQPKGPSYLDGSDR